MLRKTISVRVLPFEGLLDKSLRRKAILGKGTTLSIEAETEGGVMYGEMPADGFVSWSWKSPHATEHLSPCTTTVKTVF